MQMVVVDWIRPAGRDHIISRFTPLGNPGWQSRAKAAPVGADRMSSLLTYARAFTSIAGEPGSCVTRERKQAGRDGRQIRPIHVIDRAERYPQARKRHLSRRAVQSGKETPCMLAVAQESAQKPPSLDSRGFRWHRWSEYVGAGHLLKSSIVGR